MAQARAVSNEVLHSLGLGARRVDEARHGVLERAAAGAEGLEVLADDLLQERRFGTPSA